MSLMERAAKVLPGGVSSPVMIWLSTLAEAA